jgi:pimeloyl-ACP methyl ester carboxylesterase
MKTKLLSLILAVSSSIAVAQQYDTSDQIINTAHHRSTYYMKDSVFDFGMKFDEFSAKADRSIPVIVHSHGCGGVFADDHLLRSFYTGRGYYFVMLDFHKRGDATASCSGNSYHGDAQTRFPARVKELISHIRVLRANGFEKIYATGHSEGGAVVQMLQRNVDGVIIHSSACAQFPPGSIDNSKVRTLHLVSDNDRLATHRGNPHTCPPRPNYTAVTSKAASHNPLIEPIWRDKIKEFLSAN